MKNTWLRKSPKFLEKRLWWSLFKQFITQMNLILSFELLPKKKFNGIGASLVSFGGKILDRYCLLMLCPSVFAVPRKVGLSVPMTLDNWSLDYLPEMLILFLKFIKSFGTSQIANAPLTTATWTFCTLRSLLLSWTFIRSS